MRSALAFLVACCACRPAAVSATPPDPVESPAPPPADTAAPGPRPSTNARSASCAEAPLEAYAEISRALVHAALRSSRSSACVDGPGTRVVIDGVEVCSSSEAERTFEVGYRVTVHTEGGPDGCGLECAQQPVKQSSHEWTARFDPAADGYRLALPEQMPGLPAMTPWAQPHHGKCYGPLPAYREQTIQLPAYGR